MNWKTFDPSTQSSAEIYQLLSGAVIPRPIAFASTINSKGQVNLSPYSFFNVFSSNPPVAVFSPTRRIRNNTTKDTYENINDISEVAISLVNYEMVNQMILTSADYPPEVSEFDKSGLTPVPSKKIVPPLVKEAPVSMECRVMEIKELGQDGGAGTLMICEVLLIHVKDNLFDKEGKIDPLNLDIVGRMGGSYYIHGVKESLFEVDRPNPNCIGFNGLPKYIRKNAYLNKNQIATLANLTRFPSAKEIKAIQTSDIWEKAMDITKKDSRSKEQIILNEVITLIEIKKTEEALTFLMAVYENKVL